MTQSNIIQALEPGLKRVREALDRGGFHATARGHLEDALYITGAINDFPTLLAAVKELQQDNFGYLMVAVVANNLDQHKWEDEWLEFYKPEKWLGSHRATAAFLTEKFKELQAKLDAALNANKPIPPIAQDSCRAAFEAWCKSTGHRSDPQDAVCQIKWLSWQTAWNARPVEGAQLRKDIYAELWDSHWQTFRGNESVESRTTKLTNLIMKHVAYHTKLTPPQSDVPPMLADEELIQLIRPYLHFGTSGWQRVAQKCLEALRPYLRSTQTGLKPEVSLMKCARALSDAAVSQQAKVLWEKEEYWEWHKYDFYRTATIVLNTAGVKYSEGE